MKTLVIETSTEKSCLALLDDRKKIAFLPLSGGPELSKRLGLETSVLLQTHEFSPELIAFGEGPGSLTGVRVGTALAKALAYGWKIPFISFCSLKIFLPTENGLFAVLVDARMGGIYTLLGEKTNDTIHYLDSSPQLFSPGKVKEIVNHIPTLISPHPDLIQKRICRLPQEPKFNLEALW